VPSSSYPSLRPTCLSCSLASFYVAYHGECLQQWHPLMRARSAHWPLGVISLSMSTSAGRWVSSSPQASNLGSPTAHLNGHTVFPSLYNGHGHCLSLPYSTSPESPWHHVRNGNYELAEKMVNRLASSSERHLAKKKVSLMAHTNELECAIEENTSYFQCFKGIDLRRTEIACMVFAAQPFCGSAMVSTLVHNALGDIN
jgi:hypothetical protein